MKRDFLKSLGIEGLTDGLIDQIMTEHGKTVNAHKAAAEAVERELKDNIAKLEGRADITPDALKELQDGLTDRDGKLKQFEGVDLTALNQQLTESLAKISKLEADHMTEVEELKTDAQLRERLAKVSFTSEYARKGIYQDMKDALKEGKTADDFDAVLAELQEKQPTAFAVETSPDEAGTHGKADGAPHRGGGDPPKPRPIPTII